MPNLHISITDIEITDIGSFFLFIPRSDSGEEWLRENTSGMWLNGAALAVESRYASDLAHAAMDDGLGVQ